MSRSKRRGRSGPSVQEIFPSSSSSPPSSSSTSSSTSSSVPLQTNEELHDMAQKKGFTIEYSDTKPSPGICFGTLSMKELTILALIFILFLKMSLVPMINVFMSKYSVSNPNEPGTTGTTAVDPSHPSHSSHSHYPHSSNQPTCPSTTGCVGALAFRGADIVLLGGGGVGQEIMLQLASSSHLTTNGGELNVKAVFDSLGGVSMSNEYPMTSKALRTIVRLKRKNTPAQGRRNTVLSLVPQEHGGVGGVGGVGGGGMGGGGGGGGQDGGADAVKDTKDAVFMHAATHQNFTSYVDRYALQHNIGATRPCSALLLVVDATSDASEQHATALHHVLNAVPCSRLILANKAPISSVQMEQVADAAFQPSTRFNRVRRVYYEATVGAALPVIQTLQDFNEVGDSVIKVEALLSGTASYILSEMRSNMVEEDRTTKKKTINLLHSSVIRAMELGFTESNPCLDLIGVDVVRKGLILGRLIAETSSNQLVMDDVELESLSNTCTFVNKELKVGGSGAGVGGSEGGGGSTNRKQTTLETKISQSIEKDQMLRYVVTIESYGTANSKRIKVQVGLKSYGQDHPFGKKSGGGSGASPENIIVMHTSLYNKSPLVVQGPGAGEALTASAVMGDVLRCVNRK